MAATIGLPELLRRSETIIIAAEIAEEPLKGRARRSGSRVATTARSHQTSIDECSANVDLEDVSYDRAVSKIHIEDDGIYPGKFSF
jgi:hypothetical protein